MQPEIVSQAESAPLLPERESLNLLKLGYFRALCQISKLAAGPLSAQLVSVLSKTINSILFARLGADALIAMSPINTALGFYTACNAVVYPLNYFVQRAYTQSELLAVGEYFRQALIISTLIAGLTSGMGYFTGSILGALGHNEVVAKVVDDFFRPFILTGGLFPPMLLLVARRLMSGLKRPVPVTVLSFANTAVTIASAFLASQKGWGVQGFGYALSLSNWISLLGFFVYLATNKSFAPYRLLHPKRLFDLPKWQEFSGAGLPIMAGNTFECLVLTILSGMMARVGDDAAIANSIAGQLTLLAVTAAWSLATFSGTVMTETVTSAKIEAKSFMLEDGRKNQYRTQLFQQFRTSLIMAGAIPLIVLSSFVMLPQQFIRFFSNTLPDDAQFKLIQHTTWIAGIGAIADASRVIGGGVARVLERSQHSLAFNLIGLGAGLALACLGEWMLAPSRAAPLVMIAAFYCGIMGAAILQCIDIHKAISLFNPKPIKPKPNVPFYQITIDEAARNQTPILTPASAFGTLNP